MRRSRDLEILGEHKKISRSWDPREALKWSRDLENIIGGRSRDPRGAKRRPRVLEILGEHQKISISQETCTWTRSRDIASSKDIYKIFDPEGWCRKTSKQKALETFICSNICRRDHRIMSREIFHQSFDVSVCVFVLRIKTVLAIRSYPSTTSSTPCVPVSVLFFFHPKEIPGIIPGMIQALGPPKLQHYDAEMTTMHRNVAVS